MKDSEKRLEKSAQRSVPRQQRAVVTREHLLEAARQVFATQGFERATLQDIAELAGKTRGAFYAHFSSKEDVFFAIFEEDLTRDQQRLLVDLEGKRSSSHRIDALARHLVRILKDRRRMLLSIEFKLFSLRYPAQQQKRVRDLHAAVARRGTADEVASLFPELRSSGPTRRSQTFLFGAMLDGLALNRAFDPGAMSERLLLLQVRARLEDILQLGAALP